MKRLVWLLLAVFSTALAQVQPVTLPGTHHKCCCCCGCDGSCGMPDCLPPVPTRTLPTANEPARVVVSAAKRLAESAGPAVEKFYAAFVAPAAVSVAAHSPHRVMMFASVPLFAAHCSLRI